MNQRWLLIIVSFLTFASLAASGWLFYQNLQLQKQISQLQTRPSPSPAATPMPSTDPTADWKTYEGITAYSGKFSIKYPSSWELKRSSEKGDILYPLGDINADIMNYKAPYILLGVGGHGGGCEAKIMSFGNNPAKYCWGEFGGLASFEKDNKSYILEAYYYGNPPNLTNEEYQNIFNQILSTFKFLEQNSPTPSPNVKTLNYQLPSGWQTISDNDNIFSIGFNPTNYNSFPHNSRIDLNSKQCCSSIFLKVLPYDGGSRHNFISKNSGAVKISSTTEGEYSINGKPGLVLYDVDASGSNTVGMIAFSQNQALLIESQISSKAFIEQILSTFKFTN